MMKIRFLTVTAIFGIVTVACDKDPVSEDPLVTAGRELFNDLKFNPGGNYSCGTCHPQGDMDNGQWHFPAIHDSTNGMPDFLETPTLFGLAETAPYLWRGEGGSDLRDVTRSVIEDIMGGNVSEDELDALVAYQLSLRVPANPWRGEGLTDAQARGKRVFEGAGKCGVCHSGTALTGRFSIQIRAATPPFDIPSLRWVFATAPYFHDGSAPTLRRVIDHYTDSVTTAQMMTWGWNTLGITDINLNEQEKADLIEYLRTL